jgi:hypothetical protein
MGSNLAWNWIKTSNDFPLKIIGGDVEIDNGHLNVGGTSTSTTRYGVKEIYRDETWTIEDEYQAVRMYEDPSGNFASIERPNGASSFTIYRVEYDVTGLTTDADEEQWFKLQVGGSTCSSQASTGVAWGSNCGGGNAFGRTSPMADYGWIGDDNAAFNINETVETNETFTGSSYDLFLYGADENAGAGQVETSSIRVKIYYSYSVSAKDGDIVAGGRIYANSTQSVGDVAEYFPINEGVEIGHIIASEPGKSNYYKLADDAYCNHLVGVISNEPSVVLNDPSEGPPVGLTGRVNVKLVDSENLIKSGDFITSSNQKGLGQIACKEGPVIGYAVRNQKLGEDFVEILLQPGRYYKPSKRNDEQTIKAELKANYSELENRLKELENIILQLTIKK